MPFMKNLKPSALNGPDSESDPLNAAGFANGIALALSCRTPPDQPESARVLAQNVLAVGRRMFRLGEKDPSGFHTDIAVTLAGIADGLEHMAKAWESGERA